MDMEAKEFLRVLAKRAWFIALVTALFCGAAAAYHLLYGKPVYEAGTKLVVNSTNRADGAAYPDYNAVNFSLLLLDTYKEIISTPAILGKAATEHPELKTSAKELAKAVKVGSSEKSQVMSITVRDYSPDRAAKLADAVSEVFKEEIPKIMSVDNVTILSEAKTEDGPVVVSKGLVFKVVIALLLGLMVSIGIVLLWEHMDDSIESESDIDKFLGTPTLATIRQMKNKQLRKETGRAKKRAVVDSVPAGANRQL